MRLSELSQIQSNVLYCDRAIWDSSRIQCLISAQKASKKTLKLKDIFPLPWDKIEQTDEQIKEILAQQKTLEDILNGKQ